MRKLCIIDFPSSIPWTSTLSNQCQEWCKEFIPRRSTILTISYCVILKTFCMNESRLGVPGNRRTCEIYPGNKGTWPKLKRNKGTSDLIQGSGKFLFVIINSRIFTFNGIYFCQSERWSLRFILSQSNGVFLKIFLDKLSQNRQDFHFGDKQIGLWQMQTKEPGMCDVVLAHTFSNVVIHEQLLQNYERF